MTKTFRQLRLDSAKQIAQGAATYDDRFKMFVELASALFTSSVQVINSSRSDNSTDEFSQHLAMLYEMIRSFQSISCNELVHWPKSVSTFGNYQFEGNSSFDVASKFVKSVEGATLIARVEEFSTFDSDDFMFDEMEKWRKRSFDGFEMAFCLSLWPIGVMNRDARTLIDSIRREYLLCINNVQNALPNKHVHKDMKLLPEDITLLKELITLEAIDGVYLPSNEQILVANLGSDISRNQRERLVGYGLLASAKGRGITVTANGVSFIARISGT